MMMRSACFAPVLAPLALAVVALPLAAAEPTLSSEQLTKLVTAVKAVGPEGQGNAAAQAAWKKLAAASPKQLPALLAALDGANPLAANYLRAAVETVAEDALKAEQPLPIDDLVGFLEDRSNDARARRLAFELIQQAKPDRAEALIPTLADDPSPELRREAVAELMAEGEALLEGEDKEAAKAKFTAAFEAARDEDQVKDLAKQLRSMGEEVNLPRHFGFLMTWHLIAPFDNTDGKGFPVAYPPEKSIDLDAQYEGKTGDRIGWTEHTTDDEFGMVDLNKALDRHKGSVGYAYTEFVSPKEQVVDFRLGSVTAWKLWVNGELLFEREEYHRGIRMDQYQVRAKLKEGKNTILLKVCQNEQTQDWAQRWQFQLRVCDDTGTAVLSEDRPEEK